jgi:hypothetical protein
MAAAESSDVARKPLDLCEVLEEQYFEITRNFGHFNPFSDYRFT